MSDKHLIPRADVDEERGAWKGLMRANGQRSASVSCRDCGRIATLTDHRISEHGIVEPSLVCPNDDCEYHEFVVLVGWDLE